MSSRRCVGMSHRCSSELSPARSGRFVMSAQPLLHLTTGLRAKKGPNRYASPKHGFMTLPCGRVRLPAYPGEAGPTLLVRGQPYLHRGPRYCRPAAELPSNAVDQAGGACFLWFVSRCGSATDRHYVRRRREPGLAPCRLSIGFAQVGLFVVCCELENHVKGGRAR